MTPDEIRRDERDHHKDQAIFNTKNIITTENNIRASLWTLAVFVFTFSSPLFNQHHLRTIEKVFLLIGWILLLISIAFGLISSILDRLFYAKHAELEGQAILIFTKRAYSEDDLADMWQENERIYKASGSDKQGSIVSTGLYLYLQMLTWFLGFLVILISAILRLFD